jgi:hypothetical protein
MSSRRRQTSLDMWGCGLRRIKMKVCCVLKRNVPELTTEERCGGAHSRRIIFGIYCSASQVPGGERRCSQPCVISTGTSSIRWGLHGLIWMRGDGAMCGRVVKPRVTGGKNSIQNTQGHLPWPLGSSGMLWEQTGTKKKKKSKNAQISCFAPRKYGR